MPATHLRPETLEALLIDRALGELPRESGELLEAFLAVDEAARREAARWDATVLAVRQGVRRTPIGRPIGLRPWRRALPWAAAAAAMVVVAGNWLRMGHAPAPGADRLAAPSEPGIWARYDLRYAAGGPGFVLIQPRMEEMAPP